MLAALGITLSERQQLALRYQSGQSLWRVALTYFSPWDCNWPGGPPLDAVPPNGGLPADGQSTADQQRLDTPDTAGTIAVQNQAVTQEVDVTGTPLTLHYESDRQIGRTAANTLTIPLSGPSVPASLKRIELTIHVAGREFGQTFAPLPDQVTTFTWDGMDAYGRQLQSRHMIDVAVEFVYPRLYMEPAQSPQTFGQSSGVPISGLTNTRAEITSGRQFTGWVGGWDAKSAGLGGWSLDVHRAYDPVGRMMSGGDGTQHSAEESGPVIATVAGTGTGAFGGDGGPAAQARLALPHALAVGADGSVYVADTNNNRIRKIDPSGVITTVAGNGAWREQLTSPEAPTCGDGGPALQSQLAGPRGLALGPDGSLYIADTGGEYAWIPGGRRIRRVDPSGIITTVAGTGMWTTDYASTSGDNGPAVYATFSLSVSALRVAPDGTIYIADTGNYRVRAVSLDGIIRTVAGGGPGYYTGIEENGIPAAPVGQCPGWPYLTYCGAMITPNDIELGADGTLYMVTSEHMVRRVTPDGRIYTVAGSGSRTSDEGDGDLATQASFFQPVGLARGGDGSLYVSDASYQRVRRIGTDGVIQALAGQQIALNTPGVFAGDNGPAAAARFASFSPTRMVVGPDGSLYIADTYNHRLRRVSSPLPGFADLGDIVIAAKDGRELYVFDSRGRHLRTVDALMNVQLYGFGYDAEGRLSTVTDRDGKVTTITHYPSGNFTLTGPYGQQTTATVDANGYLATITNPNHETTSFTYGDTGLLTEVTDPNQHTTSFSYDAEGRLTLRADAAGGSDTLARAELAVPNGSGYEMTRTSGEGVITLYRVETLSTGDRVRTTVFPDGTTQTTLIKIDGTTQTTASDGINQTAIEAGDPRFGMQVPVTTNATITTPDGLTATTTGSRTVTLSDPADPSSLTNQTDTIVVNGRTILRTYDAATRTITDTSAAGRQTTTVLDALGRPVQQQLGTLTPTELSYDANGRIDGIAQGTRLSTLVYDADGNLGSLTDPAGRTVEFLYDAAGRVTQQILPDLRTIDFGYDAKGNLTSITPPGRPAHFFTYDPSDLLQRYTPPQPSPPLTEPRTFYSYYLDGRVARITRPDGQAINLTYDPETGQLLAQSLPTGQVYYRYDAVTGNLERIDASGSTLSYAYDGSLPTGESWSGTVAGSVGRTYDNDFRITSQSVNGGSTVAFTYDADDLLTSTGALTIARDAQNGLVTGTTLGMVSDTLGYNSLGEVSSYQATVDGTPIFSEAYTRDGLGRIAVKTETIGGVTSTYVYGYDVAGRLTDVTTNDTATGHYEYDLNCNRVADANNDGVLSFTQAGTLLNAAYDNQDRLLSTTIGPSTADYSYTANGEVLTKTDISGTTTYDYDVLGNLRAVTFPTGATITYVIDGQNRRVGKTVNGTLMQGWLYDGQLRVVAELDGGGAVVSRFIYGTKANAPDYIIQGGVTYRVISDHLGSPRLVVKTADGSIVQQTDYDEFGNMVFESVVPGFQRVPFGFAGGLHDADTGLVRFGARDYDPKTGRWTAKDPIGFEGGDSNLYGYVLEDPINDADRTGKYSLTGTLGAMSVNTILQFSANWYLTGSLGRAAQCVNVIDVLVSGLAGMAGPTFFANVLNKNLGPWGLSHLQNVALYLGVEVPTAWIVKRTLPDVWWLGDEATCQGLGLGKLLGEVFS